MTLQKWFSLKDNRPPPGVKRMQVRQSITRRHGPYRIEAVTSCSYEKPHLSGSMKITLQDVRKPDAEPLVRRQQVDNWREFQDVVDELSSSLRQQTIRRAIQVAQTDTTAA